MKLKNKTISNPPDYNNSNLNPSDVEDKNNTGKNFYCGESEFTKRTHIDLDTLEDKKTERKNSSKLQSRKQSGNGIMVNLQNSQVLNQINIYTSDLLKQIRPTDIKHVYHKSKNSLNLNSLKSSNPAKIKSHVKNNSANVDFLRKG